MSWSLVWTNARGQSIDLNSAPYRVMRGHTGLNSLPADHRWEDRSTFDGSSIGRRRRGRRSIILPIVILHPTSPQASIRHLMSLLAAGPGTLTSTRTEGARTLTDIEAETPVEGVESGYARYVAIPLTAGDPWWYGDLQSQILDIFAVTPFNDATVGFNDPATPFNGGGTTQVPVSGDAPAWPLVVVDGPFSALTIVEVSSGRSLQLAAPLASGERLLIESRPGRRGPWLDGSPVDWSLLTPASRLFDLPPNATLAVSAAGDTADSRVEVRWRDRWATP